MCKPLSYSSHARPDGYVVLAVNPLRPDDAAQQDFLQMIRLHLENAVRRVNRVEVARREYAHQFNSIMSVLPCLVWMTDAQGLCTFVNGAWQELTGLSTEQAMGSGWSVALDPYTPHLGQANAIALLRIFQESMTNILRHAKATEVWISLERRPGQALLRVRDNGVGISKEQAHSARSIGLKGMRERAMLVGGRLVVGTVRPSGTLVSARVPP